MFFAAVLRNALLALVPISIILTTYLYLYPVFHLCAFPAPEYDASAAYQNTLRQHSPFSTHDPKKIAPFRLLALGDPQLEGESPYYDPEAPFFPNLAKFWKDALLLDGVSHNLLQRLRYSLHDLVDFYLEDIPDLFELYRKRLDHIGNDYYLGHIYKTLHWWTDPTHVTVLGDLVGSQWIDDKEFGNRAWRYWNRVFREGERVPDDVASQPAEDFEGMMVLGEDADIWKRRVINVAGNHDIGYAGDLSPARLDRFVRHFGKANYELRFQMPVEYVSSDGWESGDEYHPIPELRIIILNDMNLDTPASSKELQDQTYEFLNRIITHSEDVTRPAHFTLVLTHIPLYKDGGICVDGPFFDFFNGDFDNGVKEQNHLSKSASGGFLEGIFGMSGSKDVPGEGFGRFGVILNGHDHEGCDIYHFINQTADPEREWKATRWAEASSSKLNVEPGIPGLREITVRSMMGGYAGNAGLMSLWFDEESWDWKFAFINCGLGTQHIWWVVHIVDLITFCVAVVYVISAVVQGVTSVQDPTVLKEHVRTRRLTITKSMNSNGELVSPTGSMGLVSPTGPLSPLSPMANALPTIGESDFAVSQPEALRKKRARRTMTGGYNGSLNVTLNNPSPPESEPFPSF